MKDKCPKNYHWRVFFLFINYYYLLIHNIPPPRLDPTLLFNINMQRHAMIKSEKIMHNHTKKKIKEEKEREGKEPWVASQATLLSGL